jgi:hypothetical protein
MTAELFLLMLFCCAQIFGLCLGWILATGYYVILVQDAFGLGEEVIISDWLHTRAIKRKAEEERASLRSFL